MDIAEKQKNIKTATQKIAGPLLKIIDDIKTLLSKNNYSANDLYAYAIMIPVECLYIQNLLNEYTARQSFQTLEVNGKLTRHIEQLCEAGVKGDAKERLRKAELKECEMLAEIQENKQIAQNLHQIIERADKIYEGVKKVIDAQSREGNLDNKVH